MSDVSEHEIRRAAYAVLEHSILSYKGQEVGTSAAVSESVEAQNYIECFIRDFVPSAIVFMMDGKFDIVKNFLRVVIQVRSQQHVMSGHERAPGLMPASFQVPENDQKINADFGDKAIGRVAPVDSAMWWMLILRAYVVTSGDIALAQSPEFQDCIHSCIKLYLKESFETSPSMLVPDASFMIDRRMGVYGHPLEIQSLFYGMLSTAIDLLRPGPDNDSLLRLVKKRMQTLRSYVRIYYWLDRSRLNEIHRFRAEQFGTDVANLLNIYPESIPDWIDGWVPEGCGYLVGNLGVGRMDFRFFSLGNLLAVIFGLMTDIQASHLMNLYELHWDKLIGEMPVKIVYPAVSGDEWVYTTGSDPKNVAWSYHNGGNWPTLIWPFVGAAIRVNRHDLAHKAMQTMMPRLYRDRWAEYYDGRTGSLVGRRANLLQTWSASGWLVAHRWLHDPESLLVYRAFNFTQPLQSD